VALTHFSVNVKLTFEIKDIRTKILEFLLVLRSLNYIITFLLYISVYYRILSINGRSLNYILYNYFCKIHSYENSICN